MGGSLEERLGTEAWVRQGPPFFLKKGLNIDSGNYRLVRLIWALEWVLLKHISEHMKEKKLTCNCQCEFTKGKSCLNNPSLIKRLDLWVRGE